jgi:hypothetical protein
MGMKSAEERLEEAKAIIIEWASKQRHDRCWYYPDLFRKLAETFGLKLEPGPVPPRPEFKIGCHLYQLEEFGPEHRPENTVKLDVTWGYKRRDDKPLPADFELQVAEAVNHVLMYFISPGLTETGIGNHVMPDYTTTRVELEKNEQASILPTVPDVEEDPHGGQDVHKLDS